jgi:hypothetical protein
LQKRRWGKEHPRRRQEARYRGGWLGPFGLFLGLGVGFSVGSEISDFVVSVVVVVNVVAAAAARSRPGTTSTAHTVPTLTACSTTVCFQWLRFVIVGVGAVSWVLDIERGKPQLRADGHARPLPR